MQSRQPTTIFPIILYLSSAPCQTWDHNPMGVRTELWHCHRPQPKPSCLTWTSNSAGRVESNIPNAWACLTTSFAYWKAFCSILPQSHSCPFFMSLYSGLSSYAKWGIKEHQYPSIPKNSCSCFGVVGTGNAWTLSITALGSTWVFSDQTTPRNFTDRPGPCTFLGFIAHPLSCR